MCILVYAHLPIENENHDSQELVKLYQLHKHSTTCYKYRYNGCRFHFSKFFSNETIVAKPLSSVMSGNMKHSALSKRKDILKLKITSVIILAQPLILSGHAELTKCKV